jgi:transcriptional regulator with XRE-family HTH domain
VADTSTPTDQTMMPGAQLRAARQARGMSLEEAARLTCIGSAYLEALESDRYDQLPNPAYVKGIMRSYARTVGIPPEPLIDRYLKGAPPDGDAEEPAGRRAAPAGRKQWLLLLALGIIICAGFLLAQRDGGPGLTAPAPQVAPVLPLQGVLLPQTTAAPPVPQQAAPIPVPPREELRPDQPAVPDAGTAVLKVKVLEECVLTITVDDAPPQQYDLKPSDQVEWMGERYFALELTNAGAIEAELNGKRLPPFGRSGDAAAVVVTADGQIE